MSVEVRRLFWANPLLEEAVRAWRKFFRVAGGPGRGVSYLVIGIIVLVYLWLLAEIMLFRGDLTDTLLFFQLIVVTLVMPLSVYGAIAGERERTTWEALILTRLTPGQIVAGKMVWRVVTLLIIMALFFLPLLLSQMMGAVTGYRGERHSGGVFLLEELMTFTWGLGLCAYGLWISANTRRSVTSIALILASMLGVLALVPALLAMLSPGSAGSGFGDNYLSWLFMHINAFAALIEMVSAQSRYSYDSDANSAFSLGEWGWLQTALYAVGALVFIYATYRSLRIYEEPKHRLG